jgi:hypothetical protein
MLRFLNRKRLPIQRALFSLVGFAYQAILVEMQMRHMRAKGGLAERRQQLPGWLL